MLGLARERGAERIDQRPRLMLLDALERLAALETKIDARRQAESSRQPASARSSLARQTPHPRREERQARGDLDRVRPDRDLHRLEKSAGCGPQRPGEADHGEREFEGRNERLMIPKPSAEVPRPQLKPGVVTDEAHRHR